jgi:hypothetical protein
MMVDIKGRRNYNLREEREYYQCNDLYSILRVAYRILTALQCLRAVDFRSFLFRCAGKNIDFLGY